MESNKIVVGITHGDLNGIGYEVILKTLSDSRILDSIIPVIYGSAKVAAYHRKNIDVPSINLNIINSTKEINSKRINIINCTEAEVKVEYGRSTEEAGKLAYIALEKATEDLKTGGIDVLVTAPINKKNIQSENFDFPGHTEYLESKFGEKSDALMLMINDLMRVAVVTGHIPIDQVAASLSEELILQKLQILNKSLKRDFRITRPRIAVLGLNPHAGDEGVIGEQEITIIKPAIERANKEGLICVGPFPADGFFGSGNFKKYDAVLAMYHDQGLIPFKTLSMDSGVNYTAGLEMIRTSPSHGTAYDLAGKNLASEDSFREAIYMACDIFTTRIWMDENSKNPLKVEPKRDRAGRIE